MKEGALASRRSIFLAAHGLKFVRRLSGRLSLLHYLTDCGEPRGKVKASENLANLPIFTINSSHFLTFHVIIDSIYKLLGPRGRSPR